MLWWLSVDMGYWRTASSSSRDFINSHCTKLAYAVACTLKSSDCSWNYSRDGSGVYQLGCTIVVQTTCFWTTYCAHGWPRAHVSVWGMIPSMWDRLWGSLGWIHLAERVCHGRLHPDLLLPCQSKCIQHFECAAIVWCCGLWLTLNCGPSLCAQTMCQPL